MYGSRLCQKRAHFISQIPHLGMILHMCGVHVSRQWILLTFSLAPPTEIFVFYLNMFTTSTNSLSSQLCAYLSMWTHAVQCLRERWPLNISVMPDFLKLCKTNWLFNTNPQQQNMRCYIQEHLCFFKIIIHNNDLLQFINLVNLQLQWFYFACMF